MTFRFRLTIEWLIIALLASMSVIGLSYWNITAAFDNLLYDGLSDISRPEADEDILLVTIDETSLQQNGKWPWTRDRHAQLIQNLKKFEPRSISLDIIISDDGPETEDKLLAKAIHGNNDIISQNSSKDLLLITPPLDPVIDSSPQKVSSPDSEIATNNQTKTPVFLPLHFISPGNNGREYDVSLPAPIFIENEDNIGHVNLTFDNDGTLRRTNICFQPDPADKQWPHLMEKIYQKRHGAASSAMTSTNNDCEQSLLLPYSQPGSIAEISYIDAAQGNVPSALIKGKDIIIGSTAIGLGDNYPTPSSDGGLLPGVEIMANMLGAMERDDFIKPILGWQAMVLLLAPIWILLIGFLRWQPKQILVISALLFFAILVMSASLLYFGFWLPPGPALMALLLAYPLWGWRRLQAISYFMEEKFRELDAEDDQNIFPAADPSKAIDLVGKQRDTLNHAINNIRDLRRFVNDTLMGLPDPMLVTNSDGEIILSNVILDTRLETQLVGKTLNDVVNSLVRKEDRFSVQSYIENSNNLTEQNVIIDPEDAVRMEDTETLNLGFVRFSSVIGRNFVMRRAPLFNNDGLLRGHIHYLADITALARADAQREEMLQLLSHDMRAPQSAILAVLDGKIDDQAKKTIANNSKRTLQLAQDFVEIARMGERPFDGEDILIDSLIGEAMDTLWPLAKERNIEINLTNINEGSFIIGEARFRYAAHFIRPFYYKSRKRRTRTGYWTGIILCFSSDRSPWRHDHRR